VTEGNVLAGNEQAGLPLTGIRVVELAVGVSDLGLGLAGGLPGKLLGDLGANVTRITARSGSAFDNSAIDDGVPWGEAWHRDKKATATDDAAEAFDALRAADVVLAYGPESLVESRGLGYRDVAAVNPGVVYARCRPSRWGAGTAEDFGLLVEARAGFCTQLAGHRPGPVFVDVRAAGIGTAALLTTSVLGLLLRRARTGDGGWAETSLYDGMLATLGCMIGRSERAAPEIEGYWEKGSTFPNFLYRCADGELLQVWFGGKGMYAALIKALGDEPSLEGYYADQMAGRLGERARRWVSFFGARPRDEWVTILRDAGVACEPVLGPGEILADPHLAEAGLAVRRDDDVVVGSPIAVRSNQDPPAAGNLAVPIRGTTPGPPVVGDAGGVVSSRGLGLLAGLRVVDFSAFVAGPLAAEVLADLGADVVKVEPPEGEAMRAAAYAVAACQRGKRSLALNIGDPRARPVIEALLSSADVVLHNWRVGVAERLGIDAAAVARLNPGAVYCHASAFGSTGRRAAFPGNDALMQAVTGFERAIGGEGNDPIAATWIPIDMTGGWVAAIGMLAGLYARSRGGGAGQVVETSLLGAGVLLHSGVFFRDGALVPGPALDASQTGYGPGYRIYECGDEHWIALVVPSADAWQRLAGLLAPRAELPEQAVLPEQYVPLRGGSRDAVARSAEAVLESAFASGTATSWAKRLRDAGLLAELIEPLDRDGFRRRILDDPVNRQLGRVASYETADWGWFEQVGPLVRTGPRAGTSPRLMLPRVGEHTASVLAELGFSPASIQELLDAKVARQLAELRAARSQGMAGQVDAAPQAELAVDAGEVGLDRLDADEQARGDLGVALAAGH
jgi:crotonobetainyl-CoA:carnitine CoA-transferase CaiB-like acyl-CoA transferase